MTKQELVEKLKSLQGDTDCEIAHGEADDLLLEFIDDKDVSEAFDKIDKWYA